MLCQQVGAQTQFLQAGRRKRCSKVLDMYAEYIVKKKSDFKTSLIKALVVLASAILMYIALIITQNAVFFMPAAVALIGWAGYHVFIQFNVEYEYIVTNGELDIDRIVARRGRRRIINIQTNNFELIAPYDDEHRAAYESGEFKKTIDVRSGPDAEGWFVIANHKDQGRVRILFEPTPKMLKIFSEYLPRQMAVHYVPPADGDEEDED